MSYFVINHHHLTFSTSNPDFLHFLGHLSFNQMLACCIQWLVLHVGEEIFLGRYWPITDRAVSACDA